MGLNITIDYPDKQYYKLCVLIKQSNNKGNDKEEFKKIRGNIIDIGTQIEYDLDEVLLTLMFGEPKKNN